MEAKIILSLNNEVNLTLRNTLFFEDSEVLKDLKNDFNDFEQEEIYIKAKFDLDDMKKMLEFYDSNNLEMHFKFSRMIRELDTKRVEKLLQISDFFGLKKFKHCFFLYLKETFFQKNVVIDEDNIEFKKGKIFFDNYFQNDFQKIFTEMLNDIEK